jgi:hypothetical protein
LFNGLIIKDDFLSLIVVAFINLLDKDLGGFFVKELAHGFEITFTGKSDFVLIVKISEVEFGRDFFEDFSNVFEEGLEG